MRRSAPAVARNRDPILDVLRRVLPDASHAGEPLILELASGTGEHAVHFARALPHVTWQPSDPDPQALESIEAWRQSAELPNLRAPVQLDATATAWPLARAAAVVAINMIHISPLDATEGLMRGAGALLAKGAPLVTYGPYRIDGQHTAPSNATFDESLRARDPRWGVRDVCELEAIAMAHGLTLEERISMPANNFTLVWRRA